MSLGPRLQQLLNDLVILQAHPHKASIVIEDAWGARYCIANTFVVGTNTDDPGLVIRVECDDS